MASDNFSQVAKFLLPSWIYDGGEGETVVTIVTSMIDASLERLYQGVVSRFPSYAGESALAKIGEERGISRGRLEAKDNYVRRLLAWRYPRGHRVRGAAFALLDQIRAYFGGAKCWTIDARGNRHELSTDGAQSHAHGVAWNWDAVSGWSRFWAVADVSTVMHAHPGWGSPELWGGALGLGTYTIGAVGLQPGDADAMRSLVRGARAWKPAGTRAEWLVLSLDGSAPMPDATWANWSANVAGVQTPTRSDDYRYVSFAPTWNNVYAGNAANYVASAVVADGTTYTGDATTYHAGADLPGAPYYTGDATTYHASVQLADDGDLAP